MTNQVLQEAYDVDKALGHARELAPLQATLHQNPSKRAKQVWDYPADYFSNHARGAVPWQRNAAYLNLRKTLSEVDMYVLIP